MGQIDIRDAQPGDAAALVELYGQLGSRHADLLSVDDAATAITAQSQETGQRVLVAVVDERVVGTASVAIVSSVAQTARPWAQVENVVVHESHRRQGVGKALLDACEAAAKHAGAFKLQLMSSGYRDDARAFYTGLGYDSDYAAFRKYLA